MAPDSFYFTAFPTRWCLPTETGLSRKSESFNPNAPLLRFTLVHFLLHSHYRLVEARWHAIHVQMAIDVPRFRQQSGLDGVGDLAHQRAQTLVQMHDDDRDKLPESSAMPSEVPRSSRSAFDLEWNLSAIIELDLEIYAPLV
jgi:hypothetical protein